MFNALFVKLMILDQISIALVNFLLEKIFLDAQETYSWTKSFQTVTILQVSLTIFYLHVKAGFTFSTEHKLVALRRLMF